MKKLALGLVPLLFRVACGVDRSDATDSDSPTDESRGAGSRVFGPHFCDSTSQTGCAGREWGTECGVNPVKLCIPLAESSTCRCEQ